MSLGKLSKLSNNTPGLAETKWANFSTSCLKTLTQPHNGRIMFAKVTLTLWLFFFIFPRSLRLFSSESPLWDVLHITNGRAGSGKGVTLSELSLPPILHPSFKFVAWLSRG